ncbi:GNAT family N-acetyltransferase [Dyella silvatica]|uniref:GNAT family N-acetyltransferase n=1 Tax=Dyella silvatica TaxID=2992128 RepID=UPI00225A7EE6|nr:GNAT family N-acetyltransferase [Dyella silvatica]
MPRHHAVQAQPWDILFLLSEVTSGVAQGHFSVEGCSTRQAQNALALRCAKAILSRQWVLRRFFESSQFVVVRSNTGTMGAALASYARNEDGQQVVTIEYVVVDQKFRRHGVGETLVQHFLAEASAGTIVECFCMAHSQSMQKLLRHVGFVRKSKVVAVTIDDATMLIPSHWVWCA